MLSGDHCGKLEFEEILLPCRKRQLSSIYIYRVQSPTGYFCKETKVPKNSPRGYPLEIPFFTGGASLFLLRFSFRHVLIELANRLPRSPAPAKKTRQSLPLLGSALRGSALRKAPRESGGIDRTTEGLAGRIQRGGMRPLFVSF